MNKLLHVSVQVIMYVQTLTCVGAHIGTLCDRCVGDEIHQHELPYCPGFDELFSRFYNSPSIPHMLSNCQYRHLKLCCTEVAENESVESEKSQKSRLESKCVVLNFVILKGAICKLPSVSVKN